ncbi:MAG: hypothetical protein ACYSWZ_19490 [Planctomycetota bacterium]|jgi:hypothetical protein
MMREYAVIFVVLFVCLSVSTGRTAGKEASTEEGFDYFANNWNVVGLKDYIHGSRITPDNNVVLSGKTVIQVRIGDKRRPLSRAQGKRAMNGWMPVILVEAVEGLVRYEIAYWATPLPDVNDWRKAFDWPTEGENFLVWIRVKATNTSEKQVQANVEVGPNVQVKAPRTPEEQRETKSDKAPSRKYSWSWRLAPGGSAKGVGRYTFFAVDEPGKYDQEDAHLWFKRTADYWQGVIDGAAGIEVPCRKATEALKAAHVCQLIANDHGEVHGGEDFYDIFYIRDGAYQVMELEEAGFMDTAAKAIELYLVRQRDDGRFESQGRLDFVAVLQDYGRPQVSQTGVPADAACRAVDDEGPAHDCFTVCRCAAERPCRRRVSLGRGIPHCRLRFVEPAGNAVHGRRRPRAGKESR